MDLCNDPLQESTRTAAGTRRYRSKSQRPCDLCRARKVLCNIPDPSKPCQLCDRTGRSCTFVTDANKKPKTSSTLSGTPSLQLEGIITDSSGLYHGAEARVQLAQSESSEEALGENMQPFERFIFDASWSGNANTNWDIPLNQHGPPTHDNSSGGLEVLQETELSDLWPLGTPTILGGENFNPGEQTTPENPSSLPSSLERSALDQRHSYSSSLIGYSNESDSFSLEYFPYNSSDEVDFFMVTYRKPSRVSASAGHPPVHILQSKAQATSQGREIIGKCLTIINERDRLEQLVDNDTGVALSAPPCASRLKLILDSYLKFIFQTLPILSRSLVLQDEEGFVKTASPGLLAAIYALALPFTAWDERLCMNNAYSKPSSDELWRISYTSLQKEQHFPQLSTVQIFLLLLNHSPFDPVAVESPFAWSLASSMVAISQSLGLHMDPTDWKIPPGEIRLRRRLWWAVVVEHSWRAITHGRSSMLCIDDWNVTPLTPDDFAIDPTLDSANTHSLRAVSQQQPLETLVEKAKRPRQQLHEWLESLPESLSIHHEDDGANDESPQTHGSLYLAYFTAHVLLLRALLRPIINKNAQLDHTQSSVATVLQASRGLMHTMIKFVRGLDVKYKSAFWPAYTRHCFCYPGLFCYMLCLQQKEPHMMSYDRELLTTWRNILRTRVQSWPLLRFAIVKVDAIFWKKLDSISDTSAASQ
ncbi:Transcriptional activator protein DAL81 [Tolypocladium ophioglossoides CBS 100239]|uniref:Transcriptional activator protein DAL81 n=1 Tax=Tolypocladium ophioglossoides (strain CBS 100239) TaxID=1163406 RepID=A0A0L0MXM0_TOLOC|nr:Transcriptional activator protein DAL81 [Tolypocladium ophioglossoides CBS 100239]